MHYPLHITVLCTILWILRSDVNAAKAGVSPEVLTSFAKNIASVLSSTLRRELQDNRGNRTDLKLPGTLKKLLDAESFHDDAIENINSKFIGSTPDRSKRLVKERQTLEDGQRGFQNVYASDTSGHTDYYNPELYRFPVNRRPEIPRVEPIDRPVPIVRAVENANADDRGNAVDGDVNAAALNYANDYHQPPGFKYKPDLVPHHLVYPSSQYGPHDFHDHYNNRPSPGPSDQPSTVAGIDDEEPNGDPQSPGVLDDRPYNLNYHDAYRNPYHPPFNNHEIYSHGHPVNGQPSAPGDDQDVQNLSALTKDQNQKGGYIYPSYYGPFHPGFYGPHYHNGPFNDSHNHGGNHSGPYHYDPYYGGCDPYFGPCHHHHHNNYHNDHGRPDQGNENGQNGAQTDGDNEKNNNNNNGNHHGNHHHDYHYHGPFYGGGYYGKFPGFPVFPFKPFGPGFYDPIGPKFKVPFIDPFGPVPLVPYYPYPGFYPDPYGPYGPHGPHGHHNNDKSEDNAEKKQPEQPAADAETISEGQSEIVESLPEKQQVFPFLFPVSIKTTKPDCEECNLKIDSRK